MKNNRLLLASLTLGSALMLSACQTTGTAVKGSDDPVNAALERAAIEAPTDSGVDSLNAIERLYKKDSMNPDLAVRYSRALRDNGRMTRAAMVLNPLIENPKTKTLGVVTEFAAVHASMGNYELAEKNARAAVLMDPNSAQAYHVLGIALDAQGFNKQAEVAFRKALDNWSGDPSPVLNNLGLNLAAQGFLDEAISTLRRAASLSPNKGEIERNLRIVQALQVQPGTATVPFAQTKAAQTAAKGKPAESVTVKTESDEKADKPADGKTATAEPAPLKAETAKPDQEKSGGIVVEDLNSDDKQEDAKPEPSPAPEKPRQPLKPRGLNQ
ncbi:MAG: tetratricopeptide repeat protein [Micavibrio aeruginosavorus]|uniref:Tetratricopeptide repeat protein n=1 Tax=Micavibrio aeruginosavorus TaxID=349221 RepID=A0A7T5UH65_9BACT|nr:MAG: tetratricopeptide repeat protein [Micavibrio aeruginosavorus]